MCYGAYKVDNSIDRYYLNAEVCSEFNREGQLCGRCTSSSGPPVYSLECVECSESDFKYNLLKYL